jgi:hypothetical protein
MPAFAQRIPSFDPAVATHASGSDTHYGTPLSVRVGHRSEEVGHRSKGAGHPSSFVTMLSKDVEHPETEAAMRCEFGAPRSLLLGHAGVFVGMPDTIGAMPC